MSYAERHTVSVTTATGGGATAYTPVVTGRIAAVAYSKATGSPFASTADIAITTETVGQGVWTESNVNASKTVEPVAAANLPNGTASTLTEVGIYAAQERVKVVIAQGGNTKTGTFTVVIA